MQNLRRLIRNILVEENIKALDAQKLWSQMEDMVPKKIESMGGMLNHFETDVMNDIKFVGEWYYDGILKGKLQKMRGYFEDFLNKRGWNMLKYEVDSPFEPTTGRLVIQCDMQPNPKSGNLHYSMQNLADEELLLLHVTPTKNVNSILRKGFKPSRVSTDGVTFGGQRNFFFLLEQRDWKESKEEVLQWFSSAFGGDGRESYVGTSEEELSLIVTNPWFLTNRKIRANFYTDI